MKAKISSDHIIMNIAVKTVYSRLSVGSDRTKEHVGLREDLDKEFLDIFLCTLQFCLS